MAAGEQLAKPRVVLADDEEAILRLITQFLRHRFEIVATVSNGREAVRIVLQEQPDVLVLDIGIPVMDGLDVISLLNQKKLSTKVIFLSTFADRHLCAAAAAAGAHAFVFKSQMYIDLPRAINAVLAGQMFTSSEENR